MTRDQALTIVNNIDLITAFAKGERIGVSVNGQLFETNTLLLTNFRSDRPLGYHVMNDEARHG